MSELTVYVGHIKKSLKNDINNGKITDTDELREKASKYLDETSRTLKRVLMTEVCNLEDPEYSNITLYDDLPFIFIHKDTDGNPVDMK